MPNSYFKFKQFMIRQDRCAMKVATDGCVFGGWAAKSLQNENFSGSLLDIGTGTGLLSLLIMQQNPSIIIDAIEVDPAAAMQATENVAESPWNNQINIINGDVLKYKPGKKYNAIISNPPFYSHDLSSSNKIKDVAHHGTSLRMEDLGTIINQLLDESGKFYLLMSYKRKNDLLNILAKSDLHVRLLIQVKQRTDHDYSRIMLCGGFKKIEMKTGDFFIADENGNYTKEFEELLKDYYLAL